MSYFLPRMRMSSLGCASLLLASCASAPPTALDPAGRDEARRQLLAADAAWAEAASSGDIDRVVAFWTEDAVIDPPGDAPQIVGRDAIREMVTRRRQHPDYAIRWRTTDAWVSANAAIGCTYRITTVTLPTESGTVVMEGPFCCVWRKEQGAWKCVLDVGIAGRDSSGGNQMRPPPSL